MATKIGPNTGLLVHAAAGDPYLEEQRRLLRWIDFFLNPIVKHMTLNVPPASPADGDTYIVGSSPTGLWASQSSKFARWSVDLSPPSWEFVTPKNGYSIIYDTDTSTKYHYVSGSWAAFSAGGMSNPMTTTGDLIKGGASGVPSRLAAGTEGQVLATISGVPVWIDNTGGSAPILALPVAVGNETSPLTVQSAIVTFRMPYGFTLTGDKIRASLTTAQASGSILTIDFKVNGVSIFATLLTIDNTEKSSKTAAAAPVFSTSSIADDDEITIDITQVGTGAAGLKLYLIGVKS